jgi:hypothetical protein
MQGSQSGNLGRLRDRWEGKQRAAAVIAVLALVGFAAVACSSGEAERAAGEDQGTVVSGSNATAPPTVSDQTPSRFVGTERFDSPLNGLSIGYPPGWRTRAATEPWGHGAVAFGAPDVDVIFHPTLKDDLYFAVVSEPLGGTSGPDWVNMVNLPSVGICTRAVGGGGGGDTFDGHYAWFEGCDTPVGSDGVVIVGTATRGYIIYSHVGDEQRVERILQATYDVELVEDEGVHDHLFDAALKTVDLRPEDAVEASSPSESP